MRLRRFLFWTAPLFSFLLFTPSPAPADPQDSILWYDAPASEWVEALPVGNGRMGAMVYGGTAEEIIQFNEDTLWRGEPTDYTHDGAAKFLPQIRQLLFEGKQKEAEDLAMKEFMSVPLRQEAYQPFADIRLDFPGHAEPSEYKRALDLNTAIASTRYVVDGVAFERETFISAPDQALIVHQAASRKGALTFKARLVSPHPDVNVRALDNQTLVLSGQLKPYENKRLGGMRPSRMRFEARLRIQAEGGTVRATEEGFEIDKADAVTFILVAATDFKRYDDLTGDPAARCAAYLQAVAGKAFPALRRAHIADHQSLFNRVSIDLGRTDAAKRPTNVRIKTFGQQPDPSLVGLYLQYGRYLLITSSRPGAQPANLQGIWNDQINPAWDSKYTVNINTEMNYWIAEPANLAECHEPLFDMLDDVAETGAKTAKVHYGLDGWVLHHNTDLWRGTAPINHSNHGIWPTGGAWLCQHLWERYRFSGDRDFLESRAYPLMKGVAEFFVGYLVKDPRTGYLVSGPSNSPELGGLVMGPTMDHQIIRALFHSVIDASRILDRDAALREKLQTLLPQIAPNQVGQHGQLQEWMEDKDDPNNQHRHVSHLWGLHPGNEIGPRRTPTLARACAVTLAHRGDGGTGWSKAWKINFWARLLDGDHAYKMLVEQIAKNTLPNMFGTHPPFQIDGNFGGANGVIEMLLQSQNDEIDFLPALPQALPRGRVAGLRARGGFEVVMEWEAGQLQGARILSQRGELCRIRADHPYTVTCEGRPVEISWSSEHQLTFPTQKGRAYHLKPQR